MNLSSRPSIAVIILNYNGQHWLSAFLAGVVEHSHEWASVWVADNGSTDASFQVVEKQGQAKWLDLGKNHGFAQGYNLAIERIEADYVVLLNSDVEIRSSWLPPLVDFMESNADYAACQPKIKAQRQPSHFEYAGASGGYIDAVGFPYCRGRVFYTTEEDLGQYDSPADIHWASGCCLFIRRTAYLDAGGLDADFFAHMEEIDLCWRLLAQGFRLAAVPASVVYHVGGGTLAQSAPKKTFLNVRNNLIMLAKNMPGSHFLWVFPFRLILDGLGSLRFLKERGGIAHVWAVIKAHWAFYALLPSTLKKRKAIAHKRSDFLSPFLLVHRYFLQGKKTYAQLHKSKN
jgi:GT2 family glycosyltransferase